MFTELLLCLSRKRFIRRLFLGYDNFIKPHRFTDIVVLLTELVQKYSFHIVVCLLNIGK